MQKKIITVTGYKGGVGKSTTAIHIACYLQSFGKTILVDSDPNKTAINWASRGNLPFEVINQHQVLKYSADAQFMVLDTPARPDTDDMQSIAKGCDYIILPTKPDTVSLQPTMFTAKDLSGVPYKILLTIVPPYPSKEGEVLKQALQQNKVPVFNSMVRRTVTFEKAANTGVVVRDLEGGKGKEAWEDYKAVGEELMEAFNV